MELDLNNLPPRLLAVIGSRNMAYVFRTLYETYSAPNAAADPNNNNNNDEVSHYTTIIMPDGKRLLFVVSAGLIKTEPYGEIVLEPGFNTEDIDLASIHKSAHMSGTEATNYAITLATALGARSIHILDTASVLCAGSPYSFPLSLYRVIVSDAFPSVSWYINIARKRGLMPNTRVARRLKFFDAVRSVQNIRLDSLLEFYTAAKDHVDSGRATNYNQFSMDAMGDILGTKAPIAEINRPVIQSTYNSIIRILSASNEPTLAGLMKNPFTPCIDKAIILRSLPGYNGAAICPPVLLNAANKKLIQFPYIRIVLRVRASTQDPIIRLRAGGGSRKANRGPRKNLTR
jgi:hypothetical protein